MTKRSNPFIEDFVQQSKVHVGMKQFNNNEDRLQKVYEKTLELLYRGAKMPAKSVSEASSESEAKKDGFKQLFLGKDGHLQQAGVLAKPAAQKCPCGAMSDNRCSYCEKTLCEDCYHPCERCHLQYCSSCSLTGLEGAEICVSCYKLNVGERWVGIFWAGGDRTAQIECLPNELRKELWKFKDFG